MEQLMNYSSVISTLRFVRSKKTGALPSVICRYLTKTCIVILRTGMMGVRNFKNFHIILMKMTFKSKVTISGHLIQNTTWVNSCHTLRCQCLNRIVYLISVLPEETADKRQSCSETPAQLLTLRIRTLYPNNQGSYLRGYRSAVQRVPRITIQKTLRYLQANLTTLSDSNTSLSRDLVTIESLKVL